jgi:hypothetical protein
MLYQDVGVSSGFSVMNDSFVLSDVVIFWSLGYVCVRLCLVVAITCTRTYLYFIAQKCT